MYRNIERLLMVTGFVTLLSAVGASEFWMFVCVCECVWMCLCVRDVKMRKLFGFHDCSLDCFFFHQFNIRIVNYVRNYFYTISINIFLTMTLVSFVLLQLTQSVVMVLFSTTQSCIKCTVGAAAHFRSRWNQLSWMYPSEPPQVC